MGKPGKTRETEKVGKQKKTTKNKRKKVENKAIENYKSKGGNKEKIGKYGETGENIGRQGKWEQTVREKEGKNGKTGGLPRTNPAYDQGARDLNSAPPKCSSRLATLPSQF